MMWRTSCRSVRGTDGSPAGQRQTAANGGADVTSRHSGPHWFSWFHTYGRWKRHDERCGCMTTSWGVRTSVSMRSSSISTSMPWRDSASSVNSANADWRSSTISAAMTPGAGRLSVSSRLSSRSQKMSRLALSLPSDRRRLNGGIARSPSAFPAPLPCSCRRSRRGRLGARSTPRPRPRSTLSGTTTAAVPPTFSRGSRQ